MTAFKKQKHHSYDTHLAFVGKKKKKRATNSTELLSNKSIKKELNVNSLCQRVQYTVRIQTGLSDQSYLTVVDIIP